MLELLLLLLLLLPLLLLTQNHARACSRALNVFLFLPYACLASLVASIDSDSETSASFPAMVESFAGDARNVAEFIAAASCLREAAVWSKAAASAAASSPRASAFEAGAGAAAAAF
mmetsp:Transcript_71408/g.149110  ORF Transcript_71408/g.149110 Transcript_71408/m.149110 type:complete len:116 (+) Transcript_71408:179-526(+)